MSVTAARSQRWRLWVVAGVALALVGGGAVMKVLKDDPPGLPHLVEQRPDFATIELRATFGQVTGDSIVYTSASDPAGTVVHVKGSEQTGSLTLNPTVESFELIVSADELWLYDNRTSRWIKSAAPDAETYAQASLPMVTLMLSEYVPDSLRPYVTVVSVTDETVRTRELKVYDLRLNVVAYEKSGAADYQQWADRLGIVEAKRNTSLELSVDADGVVWRVRSVGSIETGLTVSDFEQFVMQLSQRPFEPPYPDTYFDEATGQKVG